jgi:hypothetical protein
MGRDELEHALGTEGALEVGELEVGVLGGEPRQHRLVVLERPVRDVAGVAEIEQETTHLLPEHLLLPAPIPHGLVEHASSLS